MSRDEVAKFCIGFSIGWVIMPPYNLLGITLPGLVIGAIGLFLLFRKGD